MFAPQIECFGMFAFTQVPEVELVPVFSAQQGLRLQTSLDHPRRPPLAGDEYVLSEVPGEIVGQLLRTAIHFPTAQHVKIVVVENEDSTRSGPVRSSQCAQVNTV